MPIWMMTSAVGMAPLRCRLGASRAATPGSRNDSLCIKARRNRSVEIGGPAVGAVTPTPPGLGRSWVVMSWDVAERTVPAGEDALRPLVPRGLGECDDVAAVTVGHENCQ
jgi:hypothetical protein